MVGNINFFRSNIVLFLGSSQFLVEGFNIADGKHIVGSRIQVAQVVAGYVLEFGLCQPVLFDIHFYLPAVDHIQPGHVMVGQIIFGKILKTDFLGFGAEIKKIHSQQ